MFLTGGERGTTIIQILKNSIILFIYKNSINSTLNKGFVKFKYWIIWDKLG